MRLEKCEIHGGNIIVIGDLHLSSSFRGSHKDYTYECYENLQKIQDIVSKENASAVIFLGDIVSVGEKNIRDRQFLTRVISFFLMLNKLTDGNVYAVRGNHDCGDQSDFDMLMGIGCIKNPKYIDYFGRKPDSSEDDGLEVRFHLVNYGDEDKSLVITTEDNPASDVVLGHAEYYIDGVTNWYSKGHSTEVSSLSNFQGVSLIVSGHIHDPSDEVLYTTLKDGSSIGLFYPGAPGRVKERYNDCWYLIFQYVEGDSPEDWSTSYDARFFGLQPAKDVYFADEEIIGTEEQEEKAEQARKSESLTEIVREIMEGRITSGDLYAQIDLVPSSAESKQIAKKYLEMATLEN